MPSGADPDPEGGDPAEAPHAKEGLKAFSEYAKLSIGASAGTLLFSASLLTEKVELGDTDGVLLALSWICQGISTALGVLAYSRIPVMLAEGDYDLEDGWLCWPGRAHQVLFVLGVLLLGGAMISTLLTR